MSNQTVTRSIESEVDPIGIYNILVDATNIPEWAPAFADVVEVIDDRHYRVEKGGQSFAMELVAHSGAGTVDYIREISNGKRGGAYIRVVPRPLGGSAISMTLPIGSNTNGTEVAKTLEQELADLIRLAGP